MLSEFKASAGPEELAFGLEALKSRKEPRRRTLCNVLRRIHVLTSDLPVGHEVEQLLAEAIHMAKRMDVRLQEYSAASGEPRRYDAAAWAELPKGFLDKDGGV